MAAAWIDVVPIFFVVFSFFSFGWVICNDFEIVSWITLLVHMAKIQNLYLWIYMYIGLE